MGLRSKESPRKKLQFEKSPIEKLAFFLIRVVHNSKRTKKTKPTVIKDVSDGQIDG